MESVDWEQWWQEIVASGRVRRFRDRLIEAPVVEYGNQFWDLANGALLPTIMAENGLKTVLCAGSGVSREPSRLANVGFDVTALDLSPTAIRVAKSMDPPNLRGQIRYVVGDFFDAALCPGPFDVVIERRTIQVIPEQDRSAALSALAGRLRAGARITSHSGS
jgi:2-polyprenyl-3-methyl-5-hydroxy-6-metoxy-1,4-benzoquinol methylase